MQESLKKILAKIMAKPFSCIIENNSNLYIKSIIKERELKIEVNVDESTDHLVEADLEMKKMLEE